MRQTGLGVSVEVRQGEAQSVKDSALDGMPIIIG
jgi:hypothetical protein